MEGKKAGPSKPAKGGKRTGGVWHQQRFVERTKFGRNGEKREVRGG